MTSLHEITAHLTQSGGVREIQDEIVKAAAEIAGADMGTLQTCDEDGVLAITAQTGFAAPSWTTSRASTRTPTRRAARRWLPAPA